MQDISIIPHWEAATYIALLEKTPLDQKALKTKQEKLYQINSDNQLEYVEETLEAYAWIKLARECPNFSKYFVNEKVERYFIEEFIFTAIKYMIICRKFRNTVLMALSQQMIVEGLRFFAYKFDQLSKYPKAVSLVKMSLDYQKQFFKLNYINDHPLLCHPPPNEEVSKNDQFIGGLKPGDQVDYLRIDVHSKRFCWIPATVKKLTTISVHVLAKGDRSTNSVDRRALCVYPSGSKKNQYSWRDQLKVDSQVDLQDARSCWVVAKISNYREQPENEIPVIQFQLSWDNNSEWFNYGDPRIQKSGTFTQQASITRGAAQSYLDDFNDQILDPEMVRKCVLRGQYCRSIMLVDFLNIMENELQLFDRIVKAVESKQFGIDVTAELVGIISSVHHFFHRKYATTILSRLSQALIDYVVKADEQTIRNFTKQRFDLVKTALNQFLKRVKSSSERKVITEDLELGLIFRFLQSDFLDRKLYATQALTLMIRQSKHRTLKRSTEDLFNWVKEKGIIALIYNEKAHSQLITRSSDFLQYFLLSNPDPDQLTPLLEWNQAILKLLNENFNSLPEQFKVELRTRIKQRKNIINKDALEIMKTQQNCESWLLQNGGEMWVSVVKERPKKKQLIEQALKAPFPVVEKITYQISELLETKLRQQFFLNLHEKNYLSGVLKDNSLPLLKRVQFAFVALEPVSQIKQELFQALAPFTRQMDVLPAEAQTFFVSLLSKLQSKHVSQLFQQNFNADEQLQSLGLGQLSFFKACFLRLNEQEDNIEKKITTSFASPTSYKREKKQIITIRVNPNDLVGTDKLMKIVFTNKDLKVTQAALELIGFLFDHLAPELSQSVLQFRGVFLQTCLNQLYAASSHQQKYLKIVEGLLDESQKEGIDRKASVAGLFLNQSITLRVIDHFNVNKGRILLTLSAHLTLHQLKGQISKYLNAYPHEVRLMFGDKQLDPRLSGRVIHTLNLTAGDLVAQKKSTVEKVSLCQADGTLTQKCKNVLRGMFKEYSTCGLMSKLQCQKYHQRCVGEVSSLAQSRVDRIYEKHDTDKDGYLNEKDFLTFYEDSVKMRESAVWSNLETFGIRNDLEDLRQLQIEYPDSSTLTRHLLFSNIKFMNLLFQFLQSPEDKLCAAAWSVASRLPLLDHAQFFSIQKIDISRPMLFRYWLYEVISAQKWQLLTEQILDRLLGADVETAWIGLYAAIHSPNFSVGTFTRIISNLKKVTSNQQLSFHSQVVLDNTLKIFQQLLKQNEAIRSHFSSHYKQFQPILTAGLMAKNVHIRQIYCEAIQSILVFAAEESFKIFEPLFKLIYVNFQNCDKATLSIEYFELYSRLIELLNQHPALLPKLEQNWLLLTRSIISLFLSHKSSQMGLNSPPDQVAQGFLRILRKLLCPQTINQFIPLVRFLFQQSLFPENGQNKLKNSKSRRQAYDLLYAICSQKNQKGQAPGLIELFEAGFKKVYKKMSATKSSSSYTLSSYFYNYNQARSELGYAGIRNLGCICYMISMLQQLFMTQCFRSLVLMADDGQPQCLVKRGTKQIDDNLIHQLQILFANLELTEKQDFNPDQFCFAMKDIEGNSINVSVQQDAHEFYGLFFDKIQHALKPTPFKYILEDSFGGKTCNQTVCSNCKISNHRYQNFYPLSLQIKGFKSMEESFKTFIQGQVISDYQCDACKKKCDVTKSCLIAKVPNYFIIHLKRMCFNYDKFQNEKINSRWQFPNNLNVHPYTLDYANEKNNKQDYQFTLKGIVVHYGSADFGHYFSYIKQSDSRWIQFNDERVRQFDPHDIESDCFGGQHWRRESQNAYLLVYEKVQKDPIRLQFDTTTQRDQVIKRFCLADAVVQEVGNDQTQQIDDQQTKIDEKQQKQEISQKSQTSQISQSQSTKEQQVQKKVEPPKIIVKLNSQSIPGYVSEHLKERISKSNEEFSFTLNVSNDEFAIFLQHILSIQPPQSLTTEFLELCYECFHLRTLISEEQGQGVTLAQWAAKRFKQIIGGHGWQFLKIFGQNWQADILSIQRGTRIGMKNLLHCVIADIIQDCEKQGDTSEKQKLVKQFLETYTNMLNYEVVKNWNRFREYFEVWTGLITDSETVREYCKQVKMVEKLLDFILEEHSPFSKTPKKYSLRGIHMSAQFEHPLEVLTLLLKEGYVLSEPEKNCMRHYAFLQKVIKYPTSHYNFIDYLCKDDRPFSQKFAYLTLTEAAKVSTSDEIKPIIASIHKFLDIKDDYSDHRVKWLVGFPQWIQNQRSSSYGIYGLNPQQDYVVVYVSPIRAHPITQLLIRFKSKATHVACLLLSLLLQLQADGFIDNLDAFPSPFAFHYSYTFWFEEFVDSYYEDILPSYITKNYKDYGSRLKSLFESRPHRQFVQDSNYLIGRTISKQASKEEVEVNQFVSIEAIDVTSSLLEINEESKIINRRNIKNFANSDDFKIKVSSSAFGYSSNTFIIGGMERLHNSSDQDEPLDKKTSNPFEKVTQGVLFRQLLIKNHAADSLLIVFRLKTSVPTPNFEPSNFEISFEIKGHCAHIVTLKKHVLSEPFGDYSLEVQILSRATREGSWPRQIITEVPEAKQQAEKQDSDNENIESPSHSWVS